METTVTNPVMITEMVSLSFNAALNEFRSLYPRAFDLRKTVENCLPFFLNGKHIILYEIKQDNEDGFGMYRYVKWDGESFEEIFYSESPADVINKHGLFFINNMKYSEDNSLGWVSLSGKGPQSYKVIGKVSLEFKRYFRTINRIVVSEYGIYVIATSEDKTSTCAFINLPRYGISTQWLTTLQSELWRSLGEVNFRPGDKSGFSYFSDKTVIWRLEHATLAVERVWAANDYSIRLGETHDWRVSILPGHESTHENPRFIFLARGDAFSSFLSTGKYLPSAIKDSWIPFGKGFMTFRHTADEELKLRYIWQNQDDHYSIENFALGKFSSVSKIRLQPKDTSGCYLGIDGQWSYIPDKKEYYVEG